MPDKIIVCLLVVLTVFSFYKHLKTRHRTGIRLFQGKRPEAHPESLSALLGGQSHYPRRKYNAGARLPLSSRRT